MESLWFPHNLGLFLKPYKAFVGRHSVPSSTSFILISKWGGFTNTSMSSHGVLRNAVRMSNVTPSHWFSDANFIMILKVTASPVDAYSSSWASFAVKFPHATILAFFFPPSGAGFTTVTSFPGTTSSFLPSACASLNIFSTSSLEMASRAILSSTKDFSSSSMGFFHPSRSFITSPRPTILV